MKTIRTFFVLLVVALGSGCATSTSTETQMVTVSTKASDDQPIDKAKCTLKNDMGTWQMVSPGNVAVRRSAEDLLVECKKDGNPDGFLRAVSMAAGDMRGADGMWGCRRKGSGVFVLDNK